MPQLAFMREVALDHKQFALKAKNIKLLYIEDDIKVRRHILEFLGRYIKSLYQAKSAEEGLELYKKVQPDIILLDINLPKKNGIEFASDIRQNDHDTRIVISTAYTDKSFLLAAVELGLTRYLIKPIISSELIEALNKAIDESRRIKDKNIISLGNGFIYNSEKHLLLYKDSPVELRRKEMRLLEFFIKHPDEIITYEILQYDVWENTPMSKDAVRAQIKNIRKKLYSDLITNVTAIGYKFNLKRE